MYDVRRLKKTDGSLVDAICDSLKTAYDPNVARFFVHRDEGYKKFFNSVLEHPLYATYYAYDVNSGELSGFACFQFIEGVIFLKHIVVDNRLRGSGIGTRLLASGLADIQQTLPTGNYLFQLQVFEKNSQALSWYLSIGMELVDCTYWYDLTPSIVKTHASGSTPSLSLRVISDDFGFKQLSYEDFYLGTLLAEKTLIIRNALVLDKLDLLGQVIQQLHISSVGYISQTALNFSLVDKALLMSKPVNFLELV